MTESGRVRAIGLGWGEDAKKPPIRVILIGGFLALVAAVAMLANVEEPARYIVSRAEGSAEIVAEAVHDVGGEVTTELGIIDGVVAVLTESQASALSRRPSVTAVVADSTVVLATNRWESGSASDEGALHRITDQVIGARTYWDRGHTGKGVDVAVIDSGLTPVVGLDDPKRVVNGPDLSLDSQSPTLVHLDAFGHGTHLMSIMAGADSPPDRPGKDNAAYRGVAPGARVVSVKVADAIGRADVSQVIAAIDWVVQHRNDGDLDIRVLLMAFGTDGTQDPLIDPLSYAVEVAWRKGIVVVVASGNDGISQPLRNPAVNPYVISVGALQTKGTPGTGDDSVLSFSNCGVRGRTVDVFAPGKSVLGLRVPGSFVDAVAPKAVVGDRLTRGTGTSQAAAIVAGAAALVVDHRPDLGPDQVKALLTGSSRSVKSAKGACAGAGLLDLSAAYRLPTPKSATQSWPVGSGTGSLEAARGTHHVLDDDVPLTGEVDIFGHGWDPATWAGNSWSGNSWSGGNWNGNSWSGNSWSGNSWSGNSWSGNSWSVAVWG
ncbi:hypothetical protein BH23ACT5_BH23ACT5_23090 [soil metagenome]